MCLCHTGPDIRLCLKPAAWRGFLCTATIEISRVVCSGARFAPDRAASPGRSAARTVCPSCRADFGTLAGDDGVNRKCSVLGSLLLSWHSRWVSVLQWPGTRTNAEELSACPSSPPVGLNWALVHYAKRKNKSIQTFKKWLCRGDQFLMHGHSLGCCSATGAFW